MLNNSTIKVESSEIATDLIMTLCFHSLTLIDLSDATTTPDRRFEGLK